MKRHLFILSLLAMFGVSACDGETISNEQGTDEETQTGEGGGGTTEPGEDDKPGEDKPSGMPIPDSDGDTISDYYEFYEDYKNTAFMDPSEIDQNFLDTDGDNKPDYLDEDSDGDTIPDKLEALNDGDLDKPPYISSKAFQYAYRSTDADENGISDSMECNYGEDLSLTPDKLATSCQDTDGDTIPDFADGDNDGDSIDDVKEIFASAVDFTKVTLDCNGDTIPDEPGTLEKPFDCDGDGVPDFLSEDSDGDGILDKYEKAYDFDGDGIPNYLSQDSDSDGILDSEEKGPDEEPLDTDGDKVYDFMDPDSDNDGLLDKDEVYCDNLNKYSRYYWDTDGDGTSDMAEYIFAKKTGEDPKKTICDKSIDAKKYVDFYFELPLKSDEVKSDKLDFEPLITKADIVVNIDHTGSMGTMISTIREHFTNVVAPEVRKRVPDSQFGISIFGDYDAPPVWQLIQNITSDITTFASKFSTVKAIAETTDVPEAGYEAFYMIADKGVMFREGALPIILHITDSEAKTDAQAKATAQKEGVAYHTSSEAIAKVNSIGARIMPLYNTFINSKVNSTLIASDSKSMAQKTNARVPVCAFKVSDHDWLCGENKCCTNFEIIENPSRSKGEDPDADGYCNIAFSSEDLTATKTTKIVDASGSTSDQKLNILAWQTMIGVEALVKYSTYTVSTRVKGEPISEEDRISAGIDTSCFITKIEADQYVPPSQEPEKSCAQVSKPEAFDYSKKGYNDAFKNFAVGAATPNSPKSKLSFKVYAHNNNCVKTSTNVRSYNATIEVYDPVTGLIFDSQTVAIIVPGLDESVTIF